MRYVIFADSKMFSNSKLWDITDIKQKFPHTELEIVNASFVKVKAPNGVELQKGLMVSADSEYDALRIYTGLKNV
jgi:hypothetical protein